MAWSENSGAVTRAFDEWKATDRDIRAFLDLTHGWVKAAYDSDWENAREEFARVFDPDRHDSDDYVGVFNDKVSGLWPKDYFWMLRAGALRDAVTAFEVYLEKAADEVNSWWKFDDEAGSKRLQFVVNGGRVSPPWPSLCKFHQVLGTDVQPEKVKYVRALRHLLAHQRGKLRTEELRDRFLGESDADDWLIGDAHLGGDVPLAHDRVLAMMDDLAEVIRAADIPAWTRSRGGAAFPGVLISLTEGKRPVLEWVPVDGRCGNSA